MDNKHPTHDKYNVWYLDTMCSNHMTSNKTWFIKLDESLRRFIRRKWKHSCEDKGWKISNHK